MDPFIAHHLRGVSRTYALLIPMLPRRLGESVGLAYLLMRIVDTLEDAPELDNAHRAVRLAALRDLLTPQAAAPPSTLQEAAGEIAAERALMQETGEVLRRIAALDPADRDAVHLCARTMIGGVLEMMERSAQRGVPYPGNRDSAELRRYCYFVAGVVGEMLCTMMAGYLRTPALLSLRDVAVELGIGLQLVNILKDALKDSTHGRRYLPLADDGRISPAQIYRAVLEEARTSLEKGAEFVLALPATAKELRSFCGLPIAWGAMTLARAERDAGGAKIGRGAIQSSIELFRRLAGDDKALRSWFAELIRAPRRSLV